MMPNPTTDVVDLTDDVDDAHDAPTIQQVNDVNDDIIETQVNRLDPSPDSRWLPDPRTSAFSSLFVAGSELGHGVNTLHLPGGIQLHARDSRDSSESPGPQTRRQRRVLNSRSLHYYYSQGLNDRSGSVPLEPGARTSSDPSFGAEERLERRRRTFESHRAIRAAAVAGQTPTHGHSHHGDGHGPVRIPSVRVPPTSYTHFTRRNHDELFQLAHSDRYLSSMLGPWETSPFDREHRDLLRAIMLSTQQMESPQTMKIEDINDKPVEPKSTHEGYSRALNSKISVVCAQCDVKLGDGVPDTSEEDKAKNKMAGMTEADVLLSKRILFSKCGHVYCGGCVNWIKNRRPKKGEKMICKAPGCGAPLKGKSSRFQEIYY